jgi:type IV pilus assembly protein PilY1
MKPTKSQFWSMLQAGLRIALFALVVLQVSELTAHADRKVYVKWGLDTSWAGDGGSVTSAGRTVQNKNDTSFGNWDTAAFTLVPLTGYVVDTVELRNGGDGTDNWNSLTVSSNSVSFDMNKDNWALRVKFKLAPPVTTSFMVYYGTNSFDLTSANPPNWVGGGVTRWNGSTWFTLGTPAYIDVVYPNSGTKQFKVTLGTSPAYVVESFQYHKATWSDPRTITLDGATSWVPVSVDGSGIYNVVVTPTNYSNGDSFIVFVKLKTPDATGGQVGSWHGTTNTTGFNTPAANGSGGTVWKTTGTDTQLTNGVANGYTQSGNGTTSFSVNPATGFKVVSIKYGTGTNPSSWTDVAVGANQITNVPFDITVTGGNQYVIWTVFASTAATSFTVTGSVDPATPAECKLTDLATMISPNSQVVNRDQTGTFTFSTAAHCMVDSVNFNTLGAQTWVGTGFSYTTPAITATSTFVVKFKQIGYNILAERDPTSPTGCGDISPTGTNGNVFAVQGSDTTFTLTTPATCMISHVWVTDTNRGYVDADIAPLVPPQYTFSNLQADGHIKVKYSAIVPTTSDAYCQIPPFVTGQAGLAPNVLVVFDNSGSMGGADDDGWAYYNRTTYGCTATSTVGSGGCSSYYGYFEPSKMYKVDTSNSNKYLIDSVTLNLSSTNGKSGNYLNYRNMHKVDVIRKALMGGKVVDRTINPLTASYFLSTDNGKTVEYGKTLPTGLIQQYAGKVRFGLMVFNSPPEGGRLATIPGTSPARKAVLGSSQADLIAAAESSETDPVTSTPIAETLYEAIRYFQAKPSAYNSGVNYGTMDPIQNSCQKHFILLLTDGEPNSNNNLPGLSTFPTLNSYTDSVFNVATWENRIPANDRASNNNSTCFTPNTGYYTNRCTKKDGNGNLLPCATNTEDVEAVAFYMHNTDLRSASYSNSLPGMQNITLFPIYAFGDGTGTKTLQMAAKYGGYSNRNGNAPSPNTWTSPDNANEWDASGDCVPDNYLEASNGDVLASSLNTTINTILAKVASGTAASILSNSEGSGANLLQAVFFPDKIFENSTEVTWIGEMQNLWYFVDPFIGNSSVREDTDYVSGDHVMNLKNDYLANFYFDDDQKTTMVARSRDTNGNGLGDTFIDNVPSDSVRSIWRAGKQLWARSASSRTIHTSIDGVSLLPYASDSYGGFYTTRAAALRPYLQAADNDSNAEAIKIINYIRGTDQTNYRNRKVSPSASDTPAEWKLGDIISSTPRIQSSFRMNGYSLASPTGYGDQSYYKFVSSANYSNRGMVYVGANDGMLHAFKLGKLTITGPSIAGDVKAVLSGNNLGEEQWAYIPRNALPYLKYFTEKDTYKHLNYVDGPTVLADVATGSCAESDYSNCVKDATAATTWKTVLIGSMGLGGAAKLKATPACVDGADGTCVKTPIFDPADASNTTGLGYSSYFALDITDQYFNPSTGALVNQPTLKWEFSHPELGYATSGASIVRISAKDPTTHVPDKTKNGKWFAVFASGPTGPIDTTNHRFLGKSTQNLKIFVVDLGATAPLVLNTSYWIIDTGIKNAFAGSILPAVIDADRWNKMLDGNYQDDALYIGYTQANSDPITATTTWSNGGVIRILTKEDTSPANWAVSQVISGTGPVTTGINRLQDRKNKKLWLYFGTGRYFFTDDDSGSLRYIMGVQDRCYTSNNAIDKNCDTTSTGAAGTDPQSTGKGKVLALSDLADNTSVCSDMSGKKGWYFTLRGQDTDNFMGSERVITDAVALGSGVVLYTTFMPTTDVCKFGGTSFMYAIKYDSGCTPTRTSLGSTKVMIQMSTGSFEQKDLKDIFNSTAPDGSLIIPPPPPPPSTPAPALPPGPNQPGPPMIGKPPSDPPSAIPSFLNPPLKKIMHIQER